MGFIWMEDCQCVVDGLKCGNAGSNNKQSTSMLRLLTGYRRYGGFSNIMIVGLYGLAGPGVCGWSYWKLHPLGSGWRVGGQGEVL